MDDNKDQSMIELTSMRSAAVPKFTLAGHTVKARVCSVYDGDTFNAIFLLPGTSSLFVHFACRLEGLDTPELHPLRSIPNREVMIARAVAARRRLCSLITNCGEQDDIDKINTLVIDLALGNMDKYGRVLCSVCTTDGRSATDVMIEEGHALPYDGGKKRVMDVESPM